MKIEINYDPYRTQTKVTKDGILQDLKQGSFARIASYPLQSWLQKRLDWPGLREKLTTIARGRKIELEFVGRTADYDDLYQCVSCMQNLTIQHRQEYERSDDADSLLGDAQLLQKMSAEFPPRPDSLVDAKVKRLLHTLGQDRLPEEIHISTEEDYRSSMELIRNAAMPVFIGEEMYLRFGNEIESAIARSLARPYDSVCILVRSPERCDYFTTQQEKGIRVLTADSEMIRLVRVKYAVPVAVGQAAHHNESVRLLAECLEGEIPHVRTELDRLRKRNIRNGLSELESAQYDRLSLWSAWYKKYESAIK